MLAISNACDTGQNLASGAIYHCSGGRRHWHGMVRTAIEFCRRVFLVILQPFKLFQRDWKLVDAIFE